MSFKPHLFIGLCAAALGVASACAAQSVSGSDTSSSSASGGGSAAAATPAAAAAAAAAAAPGATVNPGDISQNFNGAQTTMVTSKIRQINGVLTVTPVSSANTIVDTGAVAGATFSQNLSATGTIVTTMQDAAGAALSITKSQSSVNLEGVASGNTASDSGVQDGTTFRQTDSGSVSVTSDVSVYQNAAAAGAAKPIALNDTNTAYGNEFNGTGGTGAATIRQTVNPTAEIAMNDNTGFTGNTGVITIAPSSRGNIAVMGVNDVSGVLSTGQQVTQVNNGTIQNTYDGIVSGNTGPVTIGPVSSGNYAATQVTVVKPAAAKSGT